MQLTVNIVIPSSGWILGHIGQRVASSNQNPDFNYKVSNEADANADVNYYVDIQNCYFGQKTNGINVGFFTHADLDSKEWAEQLFTRQNAYRLDGICSMNQRYTNMLPEIGYPPKKIITLTTGEPYKQFNPRKTVLGIVSRGGFPGYGTPFTVDLFNSDSTHHNFLSKNFKFRFLGNGWESVIAPAQANNIEIELLPDSDYSIYENFYHTIDYMLIVLLYSAGPQSATEALACGVPIVASDTGMINYEVKADYVYPPGNIEELYKILKEIRKPIYERRAQVENLRWSTYAENLNEFFLKLINNKKK